MSSYIGGQLMVAVIVAILIFCGDWITELKYAFLLAIIAFIFNLIPFCGPFISTVSALLIGLAESPAMALKAIAIVLLVSNISLVGFIGLFLVIPVYAVLKTVLSDLYTIKRPPDSINRESLY